MNNAHAQVRLLFLIAALSLPTGAVSQTPCGGKERWAVKVAADPDSAMIDPTPIESSIKELNAQARPDWLRAHGNDPTRRDFSERKVYRVAGYLIAFKLEENDDDYHLVFADNPTRYSKGGSLNKPTGTSLVAEIPHPDCTGGADGQVSLPSRFATELRTTREAFRSLVSNLEHGVCTRALDSHSQKFCFLDEPPQVVITGVAFFDFDHGQVGRAKNAAELHPILNIALLDSVAPVAARVDSASPETPQRLPQRDVNLIRDGGFEGAVGAWRSSEGVVHGVGEIPRSDPGPYRGNASALLGGRGRPGKSFLWQSILIPKDAGTASLRFALRVKSEDVLDNPKKPDELHVQVRDGSNKVLATLKTITSETVTKRARIVRSDLSDFAGRRVRVYFEAQEFSEWPTVFMIDEVEVRASGN